MFKRTMAAVAVAMIGVLGAAGTAHAETYGPYWWEADCYDALYQLEAEYDDWEGFQTYCYQSADDLLWYFDY